MLLLASLPGQTFAILAAAQPVAAGGKWVSGSANGCRKSDLQAMPVIGPPASGVNRAKAHVSTEDLQGVQRRRRSARGIVQVQAAQAARPGTWFKHLIDRRLHVPTVAEEDVRPSRRRR